MKPELVAIVPEEVFVVIKVKMSDLVNLHQAMSSATVTRNPVDPAPHDSFMGFYKFTEDLLKSLNDGQHG